jgi:hypothetical protein
MAYTTTYPLSPNGGLVFGDPTVFNTSGTYTVPPTATGNSTLMIESIGGGAGGGGNDTTTYWQGCTDIAQFQGGGASTADANRAGNTGSYFLGVIRLGFLTPTPAGISLTVTVGSGGNGKIIPAGNQTSPAAGSGGSINCTAATAGGNSQIVYGSGSFAVGAGGAAGTSQVAETYSTSGAFADTTLLSSYMQKKSFARKTISYSGISVNSLTAPVTSGGSTGKDDSGNTIAILDFNNSGQIYAQLSPGTVGANAADGGPFQNGANGAPFIKLGTVGTYTISRAGNGGAPGGGGGAHHGANGIGPNGSVVYTFPLHQIGGNGGAGRVRIWYQA